MSITKHTHGNLNDIRGYPFADTATRRDVNGNVMPESVLNDCHLWWPRVYGGMGFVSAVTVSPALVTMTFAAYNADIGKITAIAALQVARPYTPYRSYELQALQPGVGGWAAVGRVPEDLLGLTTWSFDDPANVELLERVAEFYDAYPVSSLGKKDVPIELTGNVRFLAGSNLTITEGYRYIDNELARCIVFALNEDQLPDLYSYFVGPCGKRPESDTCDVPMIRRINAVEPDANGRIYLEVDNANDVIDAMLDTPDADDEGVVLLTPIDYDDICTPIEQPEILPRDECESSLAVEPEPEPEPSLSEEPGPGEGSSSVGMLEAFFDFSDLDEVANFSLFTPDWHLIDWELETRDGENGPLEFGYQDETLIVPFREYCSANDTYSHAMRCNSHDFHFRRVNDGAEIELRYDMKASELLEMSTSYLAKEGRRITLAFANEYLVPWPEFSTESIRLVIRYRNTTAMDQVPEISVSIHVEMATDDGWEEVVPVTTKIYRGLENSSSSGYESDALGAAAGTFHEMVRFRLELRGSNRFEPYDSSSSALPRTQWYAEVDYNYGTILEGNTFLTHRDPEKLRFFSLGFDAHRATALGASSASVNAYLKWARLRTTGLSRSRCDEENYLKDYESQRVRYKLKYTGPTEDWSNDFGTRRALQQLNFLPAGENIMTPQLFAVHQNKLVYNNQYLDALGTQHHYAVLPCEESVAGDLIMSVAFKYISGNPRIGIIIGWQDTERHDFWALAVNIKSTPYVRMGYGQHFIPHSFHADWVDIMTPPADWLTSWHRLVVRVIGTSAPYSIAGWIDPGETKTGISSSGNFLTKAIPVDYADPTVAFTNKSEWDGSSVSYGQFADGGTGIYVYGGAVRLAEFTVSNTDGAPPNIVVPNKCPWLDL